MVYNIVVYSIVYSEIEEAILYYDKEGSRWGLAFENALQNALDNLEINPLHYFNLEDGIHRRIVIQGYTLRKRLCVFS